MAPAQPPPSSSSPSSATQDASACPVDHASRAAWLSKAQGASAPPTPDPASTPLPDSTCSSDTLSTPSPSSSAATSAGATASHPPQLSSTRSLTLGTSREVSTIPRFHADSTTNSPPPPSSRPSNSEAETPADPTTGNWVYPSEHMFFEAMRRKAYDPRAADMRAVVPIHNAVNERAWSEIKGWEGPWLGGNRCGGPKLVSFSGTASRLTPRARWNTLLGYQAPFDRHDWVVDRCGTRVEYVIDFYAGREEKGRKGGLNFYLDVRPKLNSWEGWKMRAAKAVGWS